MSVTGEGRTDGQKSPCVLLDSLNPHISRFNQNLPLKIIPDIFFLKKHEPKNLLNFFLLQDKGEKNIYYFLCQPKRFNIKYRLNVLFLFYLHIFAATIDKRTNELSQNLFSFATLLEYQHSQTSPHYQLHPWCNHRINPWRPSMLGRHRATTDMKS